MALTAEQIVTITIDKVTNSPPRIEGKEADEFRAKLDKDIALCKKNGWVLSLPFEVPDIGAKK
jgi:hypothetical protein